ncbi:hypothetical protein ACWF8U_20400 [Streptomyces olivaceus]
MSASDPTADWHWVLTLQTDRGTVGDTGVITLPAGASRHEVFRRLYEQQAQHYGAAAVLFFDLQPDQL